MKMGKCGMSSFFPAGLLQFLYSSSLKKNLLQKPGHFHGRASVSQMTPIFQSTGFHQGKTMFFAAYFRGKFQKTLRACCSNHLLMHSTICCLRNLCTVRNSCLCRCPRFFLLLETLNMF